MIACHVDDHGTAAKIADLIAEAKNPRAIMLGIGREVANQTKTHLRIKDANQENKLGGKREHYFNRVAQSVQAPVVSGDGKRVTVWINDPTFAQKVFGGKITAKRARNLSIPQTADAYGRTPHTFEQETGMTLFLVHTATGIGLAVAAANHGVTLQYVLTPSVTQEPDPTAMPNEQLLQDAAIKRGEMILQRQIDDRGLNS